MPHNTNQINHNVEYNEWSSSNSGGSSGTMNYSSSDLLDGTIITLTANSADFGANGPNIVYFERMARYAADDNISTTGINSSTIAPNATYGSPQIQLDNALPNGAGVKIGCLTTALNSTPQIRINYTPSDHIFEHQTLYWPAANKANAIANGVDFGGAFNLKSVMQQVHLLVASKFNKEI